jgi:ribosome-associated toxin RatA of RatAB toxin-antitoxin module
MADQTSSSIVVAAPPPVVMDVIADFPAYPAWAQGVRRAEVRDSFDGGRAKDVYFEVEEGPIKDHYTLSYAWQGDDQVDWWLSSGRMLKKLNGTYALREVAAGSTEVTYRLAVELHLPMIGLLRRKAEKVIVDSALRGLKKRAESLG